MSQEIYAITDLDSYIHQMRDAAAKSLKEDYNDNLDDFISIEQVNNLVKSECLGLDNEDRPLLDEITNEKIFESIVIWIHNVGLAKLAAQDLVECAWDNDINEMVFWTKEKQTHDTQTKSGRKNTKTKRQDR